MLGCDYARTMSDPLTLGFDHVGLIREPGGNRIELVWDPRK
jgi:hypothetical protein